MITLKVAMRVMFSNQNIVCMNKVQNLHAKYQPCVWNEADLHHRKMAPVTSISTSFTSGAALSTICLSWASVADDKRFKRQRVVMETTCLMHPMGMPVRCMIVWKQNCVCSMPSLHILELGLADRR